MPDLPHGLTAQQVQARRTDGRINRTAHAVTKPFSRIVFDNVCTVFNLFNTLIAVALIAVGSYHNLLFFGVVLCNTAIGIVQECRSKKALEKLSLLADAKACVRRDGQEYRLASQDIVLDDILFLQPGDQLLADAELLDGYLEVNESLLTGEADAVEKRGGAPLLSGSFVVGGRGYARVTKVGGDSYAAKLTAQAKTYRRLPSQLYRSMDKIIRFTSAFLIPFGALLVLRDAFAQAPFDLAQTVTTTAAALIGMMPQGLILLTTVSLSVGVIKLAKQKTLVRELYCIETLSRVSMVCLDKTGTLTSGDLRVREVVPLCDTAADALIGDAVFAIGDQNATALALRRYYGDRVPSVTVTATVPFSSDRKWSSATFEDGRRVFLGAADRLLSTVPEALKPLIDSGERLLLAAVDNGDGEKQPLAAIVLEDTLRDNTADTVRFFEEQGVTLRVLSGDHPQTVSAVAQKAGIQNAHLAVDASALSDEQALRAAAGHYVIFGRVSPEQKRTLVRLFKEQGHTVAMTGDGVNDVLALKEADCSVAMAAGSDAAKQVSQLVLLHSNFGAMPQIVMEGRRVVNNITRTASLFLVKTVMSFLLTLAAIILPMDYPFEPLQLTLVGMFAESVPGFFLTLEPCRERIRGQFLQTVLLSAVPSGVIIAVYAILIQLVLAQWLSLSFAQASTLCVYVTGFVWLVQLFRLCRPFTAARRVLWGAMTVGFFGSIAVMTCCLPPSMDMAVFVTPTVPMLLIAAVLALLSFPLDHGLYRLMKQVWK